MKERKQNTETCMGKKFKTFIIFFIFKSQND